MSGFLWPSRQGSAAPALAGFRVQSSVYGLPIPIVYGTARIAGNLIDFVPGQAIPVTSQKSKWTSATQTGWTYLNSLALALCEGEIAGIGNVWADKDSKNDFDTVIQPQDLWTLRKGVYPQSHIAYLSSLARYPYLAYVAVDQLAMPNNVLPNYSWEIEGLLIFGGGIVDAIGSDVLPDMLSNPGYGMGFPSASIDSLSDYEDYCAAAGLFVSPAFTTIRKGSDAIEELMLATNSAIVWSDGLLKVKPFGDQPLTGNGHTYTPNTTPIYDLDDRFYLAAPGEDPIRVRRKNPTECYNQLFLEFENRENDYNADIKEAKNDDSILTTRLNPAPKVSIPMIKDPDVARVSAQLQQQRAQFVVNEYEFRLGWKFSLLEPMDLVTLTDVGLGLNFTPVRIISVVELEDAEGIEIVAEDWPFGTASATLYPSDNGDGHKPANNVAPGDTTTPVIFNGPALLSNNSNQIWIAASGGQYWGGCDIWVSADLGATYRKVGRINEKAIFGELTADLDDGLAYPDEDSVNVLSVDVTVSGGSLDTQTADDFANLVPLCYVDGEFLAFENATLTSPFNYDLDTLFRALYGSTQVATPGHLTGAPFVFIDGAVYRLPYPQGYVGQTLYFKFPAFNVYGNALQSLADVSPIIYDITTPPGGLTPSIDSVSIIVTSTPCDGGGTMTVSWTVSNMPGGETYDVFIDVKGGTRGAHQVNYIGVSSGSALNADLCPDSFGEVTVTAQNGSPIASNFQTF